MKLLHKTTQSVWIYLLAIKMNLIFLKVCRRKVMKRFLWRWNAQIAVISRNQHDFVCFSGKKTHWGFTRRIGMFIVRVIPEVWPSG
ncbi:hypothetical protein EIG74_02855 [Escherichia coli O10]|nr:hypothetical protein [Escherichia coli O10]